MTNFDTPPDWLQPGKVIYATHRSPEARTMCTDDAIALPRVHMTGSEPLLVLNLDKVGVTAYELWVLDPIGRVLFDSAVITFLSSCYSWKPFQE